LIVREIIPINTKKSKIIFEDGDILALYNGEIRRMDITVGKEIDEEEYYINIYPVLKKRTFARLLHILERSFKSEKDIVRKLRLSFYPDEAIKEAIDIIKAFGIEHIKEEELLSLISKAVDYDTFRASIAFMLYKEGKFTDKTLDLIARVYNGRTKDMFECLKLCVERNVETYDFEERILIQMLFSNQTKDLDEAFSIYTDRKRVTDIIIRAYFTIKSDAFFMNDEFTKDDVFEYLEDGLSDFDDMKEFPNIYMLALSKYYSKKDTLNFKQTRLCELIVKNLCDLGMIFSYFKSLSRFISIDRDILESAFVEYKSNSESIIFKSRIFPISDKFEEEEFPNIYKNVFVKHKKIFADEIWEYQILENTEGTANVLTTDCVQFNKEPDAKESRFIMINDLEDLPDGKDDEMKEKLTEFVYKDELVNNLFTLI